MSFMYRDYATITLFIFHRLTAADVHVQASIRRAPAPERYRRALTRLLLLLLHGVLFRAHHATAPTTPGVTDDDENDPI